jgi:hypothetical protein
LNIIIRKSLYLFLAVILGNLLSWFFIGRSQTLGLTLDFYEHFEPYPSLDTLYIPLIGFNADSTGNHSYYGDLSVYSDAALARYVRNQEEMSGAKNVALLDSATYSWRYDESDFQTLNFFLDVDRGIPLYAKVTSGVYRNEYVGMYANSYVWFFTWWSLGKVEISES